MVEKGYITSEAQLKNKATSVFKFYSNENCTVLKEGKLVCSLEGMADEPFYLPVPRKGDYRFKCINSITAENIVLRKHIDADEEKDIEIEWGEHKPISPDQNFLEPTKISGESYFVNLGNVGFKMIRVEGGVIEIGATREQEDVAEKNEFPAHTINLPTYYIAQFPVTQNIWELVMGYNKSHFKYKEEKLPQHQKVQPYWSGSNIAQILKILPPMGLIVGMNELCSGINFLEFDKGHYPAENISHDEALEFVLRLSIMTNIRFPLPTEDEWEYAARGGQKSNQCCFAGSDELNAVGWYRDNANNSTHPVGEKQPNELCLYDMCGNIWEWTDTPVHSYSVDVKPEGSCFVRRGGSWWHKESNCRISRRYASDHTKKTSGLGLRLVIRQNIE